MKNRIVLALKILVCICLIIISAGCWSRHELITLSIFLGVGLDKAQESGKLELTTQIVNPSVMKSGKGKEAGGPAAQAYWNAKNTGDTVFDTVRGLTDEVNRKLFFSHNQILVFGRELAEEGVGKYLDFFLRYHEPRLTMSVLVADTKASEVLNSQPGLEKIPATYIAQLVEAQRATSYAMDVKLNQFATRLMSKTTAPIAPLIRVSGQGSEKTVYISGTAVFKQDKLVGQLNKKETRGLFWVIDEIKSGIINVDSPGDTGTVNLEIIRSKSKIKPQIKDDKIIIQIKIKEEGNFGSQTSRKNLLKPPTIAVLEQEKSAAIESEVRAALEKAQELNTDIFGFGDAVHRKYPKEWKEMEKNWDEIFPDIEVELTIEAKIRRAGTIGNPAAPEEG